MNIEGSVALVTGANRGLGEAFTRVLLENDDTSRFVKARLSGDLADLYPSLVRS